MKLKKKKNKNFAFHNYNFAMQKPCKQGSTLTNKKFYWTKEKPKYIIIPDFNVLFLY